MILIIEGLDNTGKSTLIKQIRKNILTSVKTTALHCSGPPAQCKPNWSFLHYLNILSLVAHNQSIGWDIILDRSHLGEYVYGPLYRGLDDVEYVFDLDRRYLSGSDVYLILLTDSPESILKRDDGLSISTDIDNLTAERKRFLEAFERSIIHNKLHYDITDNGGFENMFPTVKEFLNANN